MIKKALLIVFLTLMASRAQAAIEVYMAGKHFNSYEDYKQNQSMPLPEQLKLKGPILEPRRAPLISKEVRQKLDRVGYNKPVYHVVVDFQQNWKNPKPRFVTNADELQNAIRQSMETQQGPTLLISNPHKMRILSYSARENLSSKPNREDRQNQ